MSSKSKIILALDSNNFLKIKNLLTKISKEIYGVKVGYQYFFKFEKKGLDFLKKYKIKIFLDLKLHDIPNTVYMGIKALNEIKSDMITVHISGGGKMLSLTKKMKNKTKLIGVTALTSLNKKDIRAIYNRPNAKKLVTDMTKIAIKNRLHGIVCSPKEIKIVKKVAKRKLIIITPGIRLKNNKIKNDDQERTLDPKQAINLGADYIVIGRPILNSKNPKKLVQSINEQTK